MIADIEERVKGCIKMEQLCAEYYLRCAKAHPESGGFFMELHRDEINHAASLQESYMLEEIGDGEGQILPPTLTKIVGAVMFAENLLMEMDTAHMSLEQALGSALILEETMAEGFINEVIFRDMDFKPYTLDRILIDERTHVHKIKEYMINLGFMRLS